MFMVMLFSAWREETEEGLSMSHQGLHLRVYP